MNSNPIVPPPQAKRISHRGVSEKLPEFYLLWFEDLKPEGEDSPLSFPQHGLGRYGPMEGVIGSEDRAQWLWLSLWTCYTCCVWSHIAEPAFDLKDAREVGEDGAT
jgi:hypothetical protein